MMAMINPGLEEIRKKLMKGATEAQDQTSAEETKHPLFNVPEPHWIRNKKVPTHSLSHRKQTIRLLVEEQTDQTATAIGMKILKCMKSSPCRSPFCPFCRSNAQDTAAKRAKQIFSNTSKSNITFLTILLPVTYSPISDASGLISKCRRQVNNVFAYRNFTDVFLYGAFEIDVKRPRYVKGKERSEKVLKALGMDLSSTDDAYLVHLHALVDLGSHSKDFVRKAFACIFDQPYQLRLSYLDANKSKDENIEDISRYLFKFRTQHANNLYGNEASGTARYGSFYEADLLRSYVKLIHQLIPNNRLSSLSLRKNIK